MADRSELVAQFCAITGAAAYQAEQYLEALEYDLERAIDFYMEHPPQDGPSLDAEDDLAAARTAASRRPVGLPAEVQDDGEDPALTELARQRARALEARQQAEQQMEDMMGQAREMMRTAGIDLPQPMLGVQGHSIAAAAAAAPGRASGVRAPIPGSADIIDMVDDDDVDVEAAAAAAGSSYHRQQQQQMLEHYQQAARQRQSERDHAQDPDLAAALAATAASDTAAAAAGAGDGSADASLDLPEGINLEEARMLEAAMLGIPYQGRIPDFSAAPPPAAAAAAALSPGTRERRNLQAEQDAAYEESLALDRAKQESIEAAKAAEEARQQAEQEAAEAAAQAEAAAKQQLAALVEAKQQRLPDEPGGGEAGSISVVIRMPDGSRQGRRFRTTDDLQALFDFVDVQCGQPAAAAAAVGAGDTVGGFSVRPGSYRLVTQFPRKVYVEGTPGTLQAAGIDSDTALFLEAL